MALEMDIEDLIVLARRGRLTTEQSEALDRALAESPELCALYRAGLGFDEEDLAEPGDGEAAERIAAGVLAAQTFRPQGTRIKRRSRYVGVGIFLASAVSAAAVGFPLTRMISTWQSAPSDTQEERSDAQKSKELGKAGARRAGASRSIANESATHEVEPESVDSSEGHADDVSTGTTPTDESETAQKKSPSATQSRSVTNVLPAANTPDQQASDSSAASLFQEANQARRAGDQARALERYLDLQRRFASSPQAGASLLPSAELLYRSGRYEEALRRFRQYRGPLSPEALWGQARCLRAQGRRSEERAVLKDMQARFPSSAYSKAIEHRLADGAPQNDDQPGMGQSSNGQPGNGQSTNGQPSEVEAAPSDR